jgi:hypothetical protein
MFEGVLKRLNGFSQVFHLQGYVVYLVGGAVRNLLLGLPAKDFDFATDATPEEVSMLFRRVVPTGIKHGTPYYSNRNRMKSLPSGLTEPTRITGTRVKSATPVISLRIWVEGISPSTEWLLT